MPASPRKSCPSRTTSCTGKRKAPPALADAGLGLLQVLEQRRAAIPGHVGRALRDVVAEHRRDRNGRRILEAEAVGERLEVGLDGAEGRLRPVHQVHLVDGQHHLRDAHQVEDRRMPPRLRFDAARASTSRMAMSACEAPVAMLRVYCSWPGLSMMTSRRAGVSK